MYKDMAKCIYYDLAERVIKTKLPPSNLSTELITKHFMPKGIKNCKKIGADEYVYGRVGLIH